MKKGSLSLSINAIVILVLAIAMLGLGLGFTKGMFAKFGSKLDVPPPNIPATAEEPIVLPNEGLEIKHGKDFAFSVNFYNDYAGEDVISSLECDNLGIKSPSDILVADQTVDAGTYKGFKFIIKGSSTNDLTNEIDICTIKFEVMEGNSLKGTETKQITLKFT